MTIKPEDLLAMSDEDFNELTSPPEVDIEPELQETEEERLAAQEEADRIANEEAEEVDRLATEAEQNEIVPPAEGDPNDGAFVEQGNLTQDKQEEAPKEEASKISAEPINYEQRYKELMAPLKANGKVIEIRTEEEAKQLMQMGANYTKKMQAIQPHRKVLMMLENNGLLDEGKLSYLIDLDKKDPEAIKKLLQDSGIDPLDIDTTEETTYVQGNHRVTDEEEGFVTQLEDLKSTPEGTDTIRVINTWDQASKEVLWKNPELMGTIHEQRSNGIYDLIATEVERRTALGVIPTHVSFLNAYKVIGDELQAKGAFNHIAESKGKVPVARRTAAPKQVLKNGDKASAAAPSRSTSKVTKPFINPLAMSDDEFMKEFKDRL